MKRSAYQSRYIQEAAVFPPAMQRKVDKYKASNWFSGTKADEVFSAIDVPKLKAALSRTLSYANGSKCQVNLTTMGRSAYMIEVLENLPQDDRGDKFVKAADKGVPHQLAIGKNVYFTYSTAVGATSDDSYSIQDLQDFIKANS